MDHFNYNITYWYYEIVCFKKSQSENNLDLALKLIIFQTNSDVLSEQFQLFLNSNI
jgi:hypothetical protein